METKFKEAIEKYQCPGCVVGGDVSCFSPGDGIGCGKHTAGTFIISIGKIFLGMPKGFNRLGGSEWLKPQIFETFDGCSYDYNKWNVPVWKYLSPEGHTFVRGISPRINLPFLHIILENCIDKINCLEITSEDIQYMD